MKFGNVIGQVIKLLGSELADELTQELGIVLTPENILKTILHNKVEFKQLVKNYLLSKVLKNKVIPQVETKEEKVEKIETKKLNVQDVVLPYEYLYLPVPARPWMGIFASIVELNPKTWKGKVYIFKELNYLTTEVDLKEFTDKEELKKLIAERLGIPLDDFEATVDRLVEHITAAVINYIDIMSFLYGLDFVKKIFNFDALFDEIFVKIKEEYLPYLVHMFEIGTWGRRLYTEAKMKIPIEFKRCLEIGETIDHEIILRKRSEKLLELVQQYGEYAKESFEKMMKFIYELAEKKKSDSTKEAIEKLRKLFSDQRIAFLYKVYLQLLLNGFEDGGFHRIGITAYTFKLPSPTFVEIIHTLYVIDTFIANIRG